MSTERERELGLELIFGTFDVVLRYRRKYELEQSFRTMYRACTRAKFYFYRCITHGEYSPWQ